MNVLNILFNYLLIFGPGPLPALGVEGAALGTIAARALGMAAGVALFYSGRNVITLLPGSYLPHWGMFRDILAIGIPSGLQGLVRNSTGLLLLRIVTSHGGRQLRRRGARHRPADRIAGVHAGPGRQHRGHQPGGAVAGRLAGR